VLSCNQFARRCDYPIDYDTSFGNDPETVLSRGGSCIVNPLGEVIAGPNYEGETILTADLDLNEIARGTFDFDPVGHYSRPDVFQLRVNEAAATPVVGIAPPISVQAALPNDQDVDAGEEVGAWERLRRS
jgi:nitrilase